MLVARRSHGEWVTRMELSIPGQGHHAIARSAPCDCAQCAAQGLLLSEASLGERFTCGHGAAVCYCAGSTAESAAGGAASARSGQRVLMSTGKSAHEARRCDRVPATAALLLLLAATALGNGVESARRVIAASECAQVLKHGGYSGLQSHWESAEPQRVIAASERAQVLKHTEVTQGSRVTGRAPSHACVRAPKARVQICARTSGAC